MLKLVKLSDCLMNHVTNEEGGGSSDSLIIHVPGQRQNHQIQTESALAATSGPEPAEPAHWVEPEHRRR